MAEKGKVIVVSGIDIGAGATVATGLLARWLKDNGKNVVTMKMVQTGGSGLSEELVEHRKLAGSEMLEEDAMGITCPYVFSVACSPHLAARLDGRTIDPGVIANSADILAGEYDYVLLEGVGGLFVPLNESSLVVDLCAAMGWPVILVTGPWNGSINLTLASLAELYRQDVSLQGLVYNLNTSRPTDPRIVDDTRRQFEQKIADLGWEDRICDIPDVSCTESYCVDFSLLFY